MCLPHPWPILHERRLRREVIEGGLLEGIKQRVLSPAVIEEVRARVAKIVKSKRSPTTSRPSRRPKPKSRT